jgi:protein PhnA
MADVLKRAAGLCELCGEAGELSERPVPPDTACVAVCERCTQALAGELDANDWHGLHGSAWSEVPAVQVLTYRILRRLNVEWSNDLSEQMGLDGSLLAWAKDVAEARGQTVDSHGTVLQDGDSVTLIKDLPVKGANFTAKRGTLVKGIRLGDDPGLVEGRVNKTSIFLKTEFLKKA